MSRFSIWVLIILFRSSIAFGTEEFDVRLIWSQTHGITTFFSWCVLPEGFEFEAVVETGVGECSEWEGGKGSAFFFFPLAVSFAEGVCFVEEVVVCDVWFCALVEDEDDLESKLNATVSKA
jgi:hypothetical protein